MAVFAVITQSVISFFMNTKLALGQQFFLGGIYEAVKYSAPAFIFGILFSTTRTHPHATLRNYPSFMLNRWHILFIPTIWWTLIYLIFLPQLQQHLHYHSCLTFCWQFISGNAAPHLWYNTMMLQFIILMPFFWWLARLVANHPFCGIIIFCCTLLIELGWYYGYKLQVFHGPHRDNWYLVDRFFLSFLIYAIAGVLLWQFHSKVLPFLAGHWLAQIISWLAFFYFIVINFFNYGAPVRLANAPYYLPSMIFYNLSTISLISTEMTFLQKRRNQWLPFIHWIALYAYRAYLSHVFWLYWSWKVYTRLPFTCSLTIAFPLLTLITIFLSFLSAYGLHFIWINLKELTNANKIING